MDFILLTFIPIIVLGILLIEFIKTPIVPPVMKLNYSYVDVDEQAIYLLHSSLLETVDNLKQDIQSLNNLKINLQLEIDTLNSKIILLTK